MTEAFSTSGFENADTPFEPHALRPLGGYAIVGADGNPTGYGKAGRSANNGACVEAAVATEIDGQLGAVYVKDTDPSPALRFSPDAWQNFVDFVRAEI
jgi:hypothetical protein